VRNLYEKNQESPFSYCCEAVADCNIEFHEEAPDFQHLGDVKRGQAVARGKGITFNTTQNFLSRLFGEDVHAKRVYSLANAALGVISSASLAVNTIGQGLALARGNTPSMPSSKWIGCCRTRGLTLTNWRRDGSPMWSGHAGIL
jgi:hypothetical protein